MSEIDDLGESGGVVRPAAAADRAGVVALAPRLAEGVAPWRDQREARAAGRHAGRPHDREDFLVL